MTGTTKNKKYTGNKSHLARFIAAKNVIIVHPDQNIISKIEKQLEKIR